MRKKNLWILIVIVAIVVTILASEFGFLYGPLYTSPFVYFALLIILGTIIIDNISKVDALAKRQTTSNEEINAKIELAMQRMRVIENKVDKINTILEKVSE